MGNYLPKVIVELELEFKYLKSLLYSFHYFDYFDPSKLIKLANVLLHDILFFFLGIAKNISVTAIITTTTKTQENIP